ncbi:MAG TPA: type II toxin-antitoxin system VapC family toxin [Devosia sp.]
MIVVDSSAIVATFLGEPDASAFAERLFGETDRLISVANVVESSMVIFGKQLGPPEVTEAWLDEFIADAEMTLLPVTLEHAQLARLAFKLYGKGTGHPAQLNFGDCFAYALAKSLDVPLLYKGNDFAHTDIASAL